jgi:hypothetical protein
MAPSKLSGRHNNRSSDAPHRVDPDMLTGQIARGLDPGNVLPLSPINCALLNVLHQATWVQLRNLLPCRVIVADEETINLGLALNGPYHGTDQSVESQHLHNVPYFKALQQ